MHISSDGFQTWKHLIREPTKHAGTLNITKTNALNAFISRSLNIGRHPFQLVSLTAIPREIMEWRDKLYKDQYKDVESYQEQVIYYIQNER